jgi:hypothetical protein
LSETAIKADKRKRQLLNWFHLQLYQKPPMAAKNQKGAANGCPKYFSPLKKPMDGTSCRPSACRFAAQN